jgi:hypothetical protein
LASAVVFAERAVYYAAALSLLATSVLVSFSTVVSGWRRPVRSGRRWWYRRCS